MRKNHLFRDKSVPLMRIQPCKLLSRGPASKNWCEGGRSRGWNRWGSRMQGPRRPGHCRMNVKDVVDRSDSLDGVQVNVCGFLVFEREHCSVYDSCNCIDPESGLWIASWACREKSLRLLNRRMVRLAGIVRSRKRAGAGHFGRWSAELTSVSDIEPLELPPDSASPVPHV